MRLGLAVVALAACGRIGFDPHVDGDAAATDSATDGAMVSGLVHEWKFDETSGTTAADSVGGADANLNTGSSWVAGRCGGAVSFDGTNGWAQAALGLGTGAFSVTAWIYPRTAGANNADTVFSEEDIGGVTHVDCERNNIGAGGDMICSDSVSSPPYDESAAPIALGGWAHFAVARTASGQFTMYVDGVMTGGSRQDGGPPMTGDAVFYIGTRDNLDDHFDGMIDDVRIYDHELTPAEVAILAAGC